MTEFVQDLMAYRLLQNAVLAALLASVACGVVGSYVVVRRRTYIAGAICHCALGGMGIGRYLSRVHGVAWLTPMVGATIAVLVAACIIGLVTVRGRHRMDTVLSLVWSLGMAVGVTFVALTPGYHEDLMSYLFGNILMVSTRDLWFMGALDLIIIVIVLMFHDRFLIISFNEELARLRGVCVEVYELLFLLLAALTVVLLVQIVGVVMVIALLALPAAAASLLVSRFSRVVLVATLLCILFTVGGLVASYGPELPAGATIVEVAAAGYLLAALAARFLKRT